MAITEDTTFDRVRVHCRCDQMVVASVAPYEGEVEATGSEIIPIVTTDADQIAQLDIMLEAIQNGDAAVWYFDMGDGSWIAYDDLPLQHALIHGMHQFHKHEGWKVPAQMIQNSDYSEDADTGRGDIQAQFGIVPTKRQPDGSTFDYPLDRWNARLVNGTQIQFDRVFDIDEDVTDINAHDDIIGMLAWLESLRTAGDAVGDSILSGDITNDLGSRTYQLDQGTNLPTLDLQYSSSVLTQSGGVYTNVGLGFVRASGETDDIHIDAIRTILQTATGSITVASDDAPEAPPFGSTEIGIKAAFIELPDGKRIEPFGERVVVRQASLGRTPMDGSGRRIVRYADLPTRGTGKAMPVDGSRVVHFGHNAGGSGRLEFLLIRSHTLSENVGEVYEVRNVSSQFDCSVYATGGTVLLINLKPGQQCAFELNEENADGDEEIIGINPPVRRLLWQRGLSLPNFSSQHIYSDSNATWLSLPWPTGSGVQYRDSDGFTLGSAALPAGGDVSGVAVGDWDIPGSFQIERSGTVKINFRYHLLLTGDPLNASLVNGHGASLWISEGGVNTLTRKGYLGVPEISAIGDLADCAFDYVGTHTANTRFLFLHRVPSGSVLGNMDAYNAYYDEIDLEALNSFVEFEPIIRWNN